MNQIIIFRGLQGIGAGIMMANAFTVIGDLFPPAVRGKYQGLMSAVFGLSSIIGPTLGGYVTDTLSWHWVFFINIPLGVVVILLFIFFFPNFRPDNLKHSIDYPGVVLLILTVVPTMLALSWGGVEYRVGLVADYRHVRFFGGGAGYFPVRWKGAARSLLSRFRFSGIVSWPSRR